MASRRKRRSNKLLSVVVPAYKKEKVIEKQLMELKDILDQGRYKYEIICVVDGELDDTKKNAKKVARKHKGRVRVYGYLTNLGKGHAVRYGMAKAKGDIIGFIDAGVDLNPNGMAMMLEHFEWYDADAIIGSKRHQASKVYYPWQRKIISFVYQQFVRIFFGLNVRDTQVGMKFFRREVLEKVLPRMLVKQFAFDIELLSVAHYLGFERIFEAPVEIRMEIGQSSSVFSKGFIKTVFSMLWDTAAVFYRLRVLKYYSDENKKNWVTPEYLTIRNE